MSKLDCGHEASEHGPYTTGTAHTSDGREICCECADKEQIAQLKTEKAFFAYYSEKDGKRVLTTWTGGELAKVVFIRPAGNWMSRDLLRFRAVDVHGGRWYGTTRGSGMYARMHRAVGAA